MGVASGAQLRIAGWSGIVFSVLSLIVLPMIAFALPPALGASGAAFAAFYGAHRWGFLIGNYLGIAAFVPGFVQLAVLTSSVRRLEGPDGWISTLVLSSGTFAYAVFGCSLAVFQVFPFLLDPRLEAAMEAMAALGSVWFALDGLAALPLVIAVGLATVRLGVLPPWFARATWVMAPLAVLMSLGALTTAPIWLAGGGLLTGLGLVAFFLWTGAIGVLQIRAAAASA